MEDIFAAEDADDPEVQRLLDEPDPLDEDVLEPSLPLEEPLDDEDVEEEREPRIHRPRDAPKRTRQARGER
jgi:hypothetical protein